MKLNLKYILVLSFIFFLSTKGFGQTQQILLNSKIKKQVIDSISKKLKTNYIYLDTALKMGNFIKHQLNDGAYDTIKTPKVFAAALTKDILSVYHDGHLSIDYNPGFSEGSSIKNPDIEKQQNERRLNFRKRVNFGFEKAEILPGDIGYLKIRGFFPPDRDTKEMTIAALRFISSSEALIIDLRNNGGGDPDMVSYICSFFFTNRTHLNDLYVRKENSTTSYWTTPDTTLRALNTIPIYILTSKETFSAGEELTYDLQTQKRAIVIGETTGGGAHPVQPYAGGNGFVANIPFARAINPVTKTNWETVGVKPDVEIAADKALDAALSKITASGK
jgi:hypothetical protein